jgi:hypothetical protein
MSSSLSLSPLSPMETKHNETFKVVYNACYGGFDLSAHGIDVYNRRTSKNITDPECIAREDHVLIDIVETMAGKDINKKHSKLKVKEFSKKFKNFLLWQEYDGYESVRIDYNKYITDNVKHILSSSLSSDEKIQKISDLYKDKEI